MFNAVLLFCSFFSGSVCFSGEKSLDKPDIHGRIPLHCAIRTGSLENVRELLRQGASINTCERFSGQTPLMLAAMENRSDIAELLCKKGVDIEAVSDTGFHTAAWFATINGSIDALRVLLKSGAKVDAACDSSGRTLLTDAIDYGQRRAIECLIEYKANVDAEDDFKRTPVDRALDFYFATDDSYAYYFLKSNGAKITKEQKKRMQAIKELLPKENF